MALPDRRRRQPVLFFDIGNVLIGFNAAQAARKIAWELRLNPFRIARYLWNSNIVEEIERGAITPRQLYRKFRTEFGYEGDYADFTELFCGHFTIKRASAALFRILARRYPTYLLSNINDLHYKHIRRHYSFLRHARGAVLSYRLGLRKPEPAIYRAALKMAGARASRAIFIDDIQENVESALKLGIKAIRFSDAQSLRRELSSLGLIVK